MKQFNGIWLPDDDTHFAHQIHTNGTYQVDAFNTAASLMKNAKLFFDIGAHVGLWSLMAIKAGFKEIHAFEPNRKTFECLERNLANHSKAYDTYCYNYGVSSIKNIWMRVIEEKQGNSGAVKLVNNEPERDKQESNAVVTPIDNSFILHEVIHKWNIKPHQCLVKIDTEGMEASCVLGMDKILYALRPVVVVEQRTNEDALEILQKMGMQIINTVRKDYILKWKNL